MEIYTFWKRVKNQIKKRGITQAKTAMACGISYNTFRGWMAKGIIPPLADAHALSLFLDVSLDYLIRGRRTDIIYAERKKNHNTLEWVAYFRESAEKVSGR